MKPPVIVLAGPTGVGKTKLSLALAKALDAEIVSADSMQVYRGLDIGTAKASKEEQALVPHHLIDVANPEEDFNIVRYVELGREAIRDIHSRQKIPLIVGGTGFYIQALIKDLDFSEEEDDGVREALIREAEQGGAKALYQRLQTVDPAAAAAIHPNNLKRVIRALEYYEKTGGRISALNTEQSGKESPYRVLYLVLTLPRETLYRQIEARVDRMMEEGLLEETKRLLERPLPPDATALQSIGYKELAGYIRGDDSREEAVRRIKLASRHYAKRQITWFKREKDTVWIDKSSLPDEESLLQHALQICREFLTGEML